MRVCCTYGLIDAGARVDSLSLTPPGIALGVQLASQSQQLLTLVSLTAHHRMPTIQPRLLEIARSHLHKHTHTTHALTVHTRKSGAIVTVTPLEMCELHNQAQAHACRAKAASRTGTGGSRGEVGLLTGTAAIRSKCSFVPHFVGLNATVFWCRCPCFLPPRAAGRCDPELGPPERSCPGMAGGGRTSNAQTLSHLNHVHAVAASQSSLE